MADSDDVLSIQRDFEELVFQILKSYFKRVERAETFGRDFLADFLVVTETDKNAAVVIKAYKSFSAPRGAIVNASRRLAEFVTDSEIDKGIILTLSRVHPEFKTHFAYKNILFYDFDTLQFLTDNSISQANELERIQQGLFEFRNEPVPERKELSRVELISKQKSPKEKPPHSVKNYGNEICQEIRDIEPGKKNAAKFESLCIKALKYLFDDDLMGWKPQRNSSSSLHRYDLVTKVSSNQDFFNSLITDFRGRYIIFEFKNYKNKISQKEIYSTEKYLLPKAMRSTAIIISRKGMNKNAKRVSAGALREGGKLILGLDIDQVCKMLHLKDNGDDYYSVLYELIDDLLERLER